MQRPAKTNVVNVTRVVPAGLKFPEIGFLYIPLDSLGNVVEPKKALTLECWKYTGERRQHLYVASSFQYAMMRMPEGDTTYLVGDVFQSINDSNAGIKWLSEVHRHPEGDIGCPKFTIQRIVKETAA